jgi:NAD(P)-dependent dehydrogenase (short-subunit alcohol dehydrogenase family)
LEHHEGDVVTADARPLSGRRAIVTGAADGLGRAFALALADAGASVAVCDVLDRVDAVAHEVEARGVTGYGRLTDVRDADAVRAFVEGAAGHLGGIDLLVNNAATYLQTAPTTDSWERAIEDFHFVVDVNYRGAFLVGRAVIPHVVQQGGDIVNITTDHIHTCGYPEAVDHTDAPDCRWSGMRRPPLGGAKYDVYDSSKWALKGLTHVWAAALAEHGVRVNSLGMGATDTPMIRRHLEAKGTRPPTNLMRPEQVAAVLVDLLLEGPQGRTGDSVEVWLDHPCVLPPASLDGKLAARALAASR